MFTRRPFNVEVKYFRRRIITFTDTLSNKKLECKELALLEFKLYSYRQQLYCALIQ